MAFDRLPGNDRECWKTAQIEEECNRCIELDGDRSFINCMNSNLPTVFYFAQVIRLSVFDVEKLTGIVSCSCGIERAKPGIQNIRRSNPLAGGPHCIAAQVERVCFPIR